MGSDSGEGEASLQGWWRHPAHSQHFSTLTALSLRPSGVVVVTVGITGLFSFSMAGGALAVTSGATSGRYSPRSSAAGALITVLA